MMMNLMAGRWGNDISLDIIWQAILGVTDQYQRARITEEAYLEYCASLKLQLAQHLASASDRVRYTVGEGDEAVVARGAKTGHIEEGPEFRFMLYRYDNDYPGDMHEYARHTTRHTSDFSFPHLTYRLVFC
jgi:hypothetical protein